MMGGRVIEENIDFYRYLICCLPVYKYFKVHRDKLKKESVRYRGELIPDKIDIMCSTILVIFQRFAQVQAFLLISKDMMMIVQTAL